MAWSNKQRGLYLPIISDILGAPVDRGKILVLLYDASTQWLSLILTIASELIRDGYVVAVTTVSTPPSQVRQQLAVALPNVPETRNWETADVDRLVHLDDRKKIS